MLAVAATQQLGQALPQRPGQVAMLPASALSPTSADHCGSFLMVREASPEEWKMGARPQGGVKCKGVLLHAKQPVASHTHCLLSCPDLAPKCPTAAG